MLGNKIIIYGFGVSGISAAKTLTAQNIRFSILDQMATYKQIGRASCRERV